MKRSLFALALAAASITRPAPAHACSCGRPSVAVSPGAREAAPTNARVRVTYEASIAVDAQSVSVRPAGGAALEVDRIVLSSADARVVELVPRQPLAAKTRHEVVAAAPGGGKPGVIGEFTTGDAADTTPPEWSGVTKAVFVKAKAVCCNCSTGDPYALLTVGEVPDAIFGVWLPDANQQLDYSKPPLIYVSAWDDKLSLGHQSMCSAANFVFPAKTKQRLGIAPVDAAGNQGTPSEVVLDLAKPATKAP